MFKLNNKDTKMTLLTLIFNIFPRTVTAKLKSFRWLFAIAFWRWSVTFLWTLYIFFLFMLWIIYWFLRCKKSLKIALCWNVSFDSLSIYNSNQAWNNLGSLKIFSLEDQIYRQIFGIFVKVVQIVNVPERAIR